MDSDLVRLPDGRRAQLWCGGAATGPLVVAFHGCPDTRHVAMTGEAAAAEAGVRLLCVNRPGYGRSDPHESTHGSVADDAITVARSLTAGPVAVLGMSVGGAYAVSAAARHPDVVAALGLVAVQRPAPEAGSVAEKVERFRPGFADHVAEVDPVDPDDAALARRHREQLPAQDAALLATLPDSAVAASVREALASPDGYLRDAALLLSPWEHDATDVRCPTTSWFGELDDRSPASGAAALTSAFPPGSVVIRPGTTHLATLLGHWPDVLATLRRHLGD